MSPTDLICPSCGTPQPRGSRACRSCGAVLPASTPPPTAAPMQPPPGARPAAVAPPPAGPTPTGPPARSRTGPVVIGAVIGALVVVVIALAIVVLTGDDDGASSDLAVADEPAISSTSAAPSTLSIVTSTTGVAPPPPSLPSTTTTRGVVTTVPPRAQVPSTGMRCPSEVVSESGDAGLTIVGTYVTPSFTVTICTGRSGTWYHGRDNDDADRTISLPAEPVGGGYVAVTGAGGVVYEIDSSRLVVTDQGDVLVDEPVRSTR